MSGRSMVLNPDGVCVFLFVCVYMCLLYMQHIFTAYSIGKHLLESPVSNLQFRRLSLYILMFWITYAYSYPDDFINININNSSASFDVHRGLHRAMSISVHVALLSGRSIDLTISQESRRLGMPRIIGSGNQLGRSGPLPMTDPWCWYTNIKGVYGWDPCYHI
jgi:hypothetical protein